MSRAASDHVRFLTNDESTAWLRGHEVRLDDRGRPDHDGEGLATVRASLPPTLGQILHFCRFLSGCLEPRSRCLLWVTGWGVWRSSENWHLYHRLRQSHGDGRLIGEAPGHLFLDFEQADFVSYLELGVLFGWDMWLVPHLDYGGADTARAFVSHDEYVVLYHRDEAEVGKWRAALEAARCKIFP